MVSLKILANILDDDITDMEVPEGTSIREMADKYINGNSYSGDMVECYDCDTGRTYYAPIEDDESTLSLAVIVNGKDADIDYIAKDNDSIQIIVVPSSSNQAAGAVGGAVVGAVVGMIILSLVFPPASAATAFWIGTVCFAAVGSLAGFLIGSNTDSSSSSSSKDASSLPDVQGSKNPVLIGNQYPMVIGRHLVTQFITGSPWAEFSGYDGGTEYIRSLYLVGYAPLKLTEFKFDSLPLAHNRTWTTTDGTSVSLPTVLKGMIRGVDSSDSTDYGQTLKRWSSNDVQIEILQQSQDKSVSVDYGTIFNQTVIQNDAHSTPLFIADASLGSLSKVTYHGSSFTNGLRTNSIRFTEQDPLEITVTLDFGSGLYKTRAESSKTKYYTIPCFVAIQWRVYNCDRGDTSGNESGEDDGWISFDDLNYNDTGVSKEHLLPSDCKADSEEHAGNTIRYTMTAAQIAAAITAGEIIEQGVGSGTSTSYSTYNSGTSSGVYPVYKYVSNSWDIVVTDGTTKATQTCYRLYHYNDDWIGSYVFNMQHIVEKINSTEDNSSGNCGTNEFRVTSTVNLKTYIDKLIAAGTVSSYKEFLLPDTNTTKSIEVRVVRISPCYINQTTSSSSTIGAYTYQDAFSWKYLTTKTFNEETLYNEGTLVARKPLPEDDMRKFCLVAVQVKADTLQTITGQMDKFSCIAESFSPTYDEPSKSWIPSSVTATNKYYSPLSGGTRTEITKEEFESYRQDGKDAICMKGGNDYVSQLCSEIFVDSNKDTIHVDSNGYISTSGTAYTRYVMNDSLEKKYICANPASGIMLACVGGHLGRDALGYGAIDLASVGEFFTDCSDMTDGTPDTTSSDGLLHQYFKCNAYVYQAMKLEDMLSKICVTGRAAYTRQGFKLFVVQDKAVEYPVGMINQQNCISSSNTMTYETPPSGYQIEFNDEDDGYDTNYVYAMSDGEDKDNPRNSIESLQIEWVTNVNQIWSLARYALANIVLQREVLTRKIGMEGYSMGFGNVVKISDDSLLLGEGSGRITQLIQDEDYIYGFIMDESYEYKGTVDSDGLCTQGVDILQPIQYKESRIVTIRMCTTSGIAFGTETLKPSVGWTNRVLFNKKVSKTAGVVEGAASVMYLPAVDNIVAIGEVENITAEYRIKKISADKEGKFDLTLIPYNEKLYNYGAELPSFQNHITIPDRSAGDTYNLGESLSTKQLLEQMATTAENVETATTENLTEGTATCEAPDTPVISSAVATMDGITATCSEFSSGLRNTIKVMTWQLQKGADADWVTVGTSTTGSFTYSFGRSTDGYPEASSLKNWSIRADMENIYSVASEYSASLAVDTDSYGTWIPKSPSATGASPSLSKTVTKRTVTLRMAQPSSSTTLYGAVAYGITVERSSPPADTQFYVPNLTADPYGSIDNYKDATATEPVWVSGSFSQTLPLYGQDSVLWKLQYSSGGTVVKTGYTLALTNLPTSDFIAVPSDATKTTDETTGYMTWTWTDGSTGYVYTYAQESMPDPQKTTYLYRIQTKNTTTGAVITDTVDVSATVSPSTVEDIVNAAITENKLADDAVTTDKLAAGTVTAEKIFVKALSAITADLGQVSSGALFGDGNNYHILSDGTYTDPNTGVTATYKAGEFKVGNTGGDYLQCTNKEDGTYTISLKSSAFQITSTGVDINGTIYAYENTGALAESTSLRRVVISANGITIQMRESVSVPWSSAVDTAKLTGDKYGNLLLTNDSTYVPDYVTPRRNTDTVYHLDGTALDTAGTNAAEITAYGDYVTGEVWTPDDKGKELYGAVTKDVGFGTFKAVAFWCRGKKLDVGGNIVNLDAYTSSDDGANMNKRITSDKTAWGLTSTQVSNGVIKYYKG